MITSEDLEHFADMMVTLPDYPTGCAQGLMAIALELQNEACEDINEAVKTTTEVSAEAIKSFSESGNPYPLLAANAQVNEAYLRVMSELFLLWFGAAGSLSAEKVCEHCPKFQPVPGSSGDSGTAKTCVVGCLLRGNGETKQVAGAPATHVVAGPASTKKSRKRQDGKAAAHD